MPEIYVMWIISHIYLYDFSCFIVGCNRAKGYFAAMDIPVNEKEWLIIRQVAAAAAALGLDAYVIGDLYAIN